jgi:ectoine hydroxylase-related dioxygenase (phytanoyl-CoA dioxygenase family)
MSFAAALLFVTPALAVDATGIPICDALLTRYEECTVELPRANIHAAQKELLEGAMSLRANASNPELRPSLEKFCADTFEAMKASSAIKACMSK